MLSVCVMMAVLFRNPQIVPKVEQLEMDAKTAVYLDASSEVQLKCGDAAARDWVGDHFKRWFNQSPKISLTAPPEADVEFLGDEGYRLTAAPTATSSAFAITAKNLTGVRYAMFTLRQIAERDSKGITVHRYRLPQLKIVDRPALKFRGMHFCWMPEMSAELIEREILLAAYYKFNYVVLETWGVYRSKRYPWFGWPNGKMTPEKIHHLVSVARDMGITLIPQLNVFGHASCARSCVGKHATLDFGPEYQPLFEPGANSGSVGAAWNWCLSNPDAVEVVRNLVLELHDCFGRPPFFHIGCDEADAPSCADCRAAPSYAKLVADHISGIAKLLDERGARAMMWHDMLIRAGDPRWKGFYANGSDETAKLPQLLPKSVVVCDWYYGNDPGGGMNAKNRNSVTNYYPTLTYFSKECGLATLTCPWEEPAGIRAQTKFAIENGLFGVLGTSWHHFGGERFPLLMQRTSCGAWGRGEYVQSGHFAVVWRFCGWDMGAKSYAETGWYDTQVSRDIHTR